MDYSHDQWGYGGLIGLAVAVLAMVAVVAAVATSEATGLFLLMGGWVALVGLIVLGFSRLRVEVGADAVRIAFFFGWPRKSIPLSDIESVAAVRNRWWYGWGIRRAPMGWLWNVHGLDAVELLRNNGKKFRIGTDEPEELKAAIQLRIGR